MSNAPQYLVYAVKDRGEDKKGIWTRIGAAWKQQKGDGINIQLEALPLRDERLQVELTTMANLTPDGTDPIGDQIWDENSYSRCDACGYDGKVARFYCDKVQS